jgi:hypothetical protein
MKNVSLSRRMPGGINQGLNAKVGQILETKAREKLDVLRCFSAGQAKFWSVRSGRRRQDEMWPSGRSPAMPSDRSRKIGKLSRVHNNLVKNIASGEQSSLKTGADPSRVCGRSLFDKLPIEHTDRFSIAVRKL